MDMNIRGGFDMFDSRYSNLLTVLLIIAIVGIVGLLMFLGIDMYKKYYIEKEARTRCKSI